MRSPRERGLHRRSKIIVGVGTLSNAKALRWMSQHVPGVHIPESVIRRIALATDQKAEGLEVLVETIRAIRQIEGVAGVHSWATATRQPWPKRSFGRASVTARSFIRPE